MKQHWRLSFSPISAKSISRMAAAGVFLIGILTLAGWALDITLLKSIRPEWNSMEIVTAVCLMVSAAGLACLLGARPWMRRLSVAAGVAIGAEAALNLIAYGLGSFTGHDPSWANWPIARWLLSPSDRMDAIAALIFLGYGCALALLGTGSRRQAGVAHAIALSMATLSYLVLAGYIFNVLELHSWLGASIALHTDISFCALCIGILCARSDTWLMSVLASRQAGGAMARRLLPAVLILPLVIGWLRLQGERSGHFGSEVGVALVAVTYTVCFLCLVWLSSNFAIGRQEQADEVVRRAMEDLARSNKDLEQFAYVASHDLQEPLRAVAGFMAILKQEYGGKLDANAQGYIGHAVGGAERMQALINGLLAYSRVNARGGAFKPINMQAAFDAALANLRTAIQESDAHVTSDSLPTVIADASQMTQLLQNLIGNAIRFRGQRRPEIHVWAKREDRRWVLGVRDNGIGIEPQYFDRIFLIFQRLHSRTRYPGTGIGLAVCKRIVERHSGAIWVESKMGEGSTFCFTIPDRGEGR